MDVKDILARVSDELGMRRVFGEPIERDGTLIIPVALFAGGGGAGTDQAAGKDAAEATDAEPEKTAADGEEEPGKRGQSGAGFGGYVRPLGVYEIKDGQARFVPAVHATAIAITAIVSGALVGAVAVGRLLRR